MVAVRKDFLFNYLLARSFMNDKNPVLRAVASPAGRAFMALVLVLILGAIFGALIYGQCGLNALWLGSIISAIAAIAAATAPCGAPVPGCPTSMRMT